MDLRKTLPLDFPTEPILGLETDEVRAHGASPEEIFSRFADRPNSGLLLSGGEHDAARFSFFGIDPFLVIRSRGDLFQCSYFGRNTTVRCNPFDGLREVLRTFRVGDHSPVAPFPAGGIGYFGYELGRWIERLPGRAADDLGLPELYFAFYRSILSFDHAAGSCRLNTIDLRDDPAGRTHRITLRRIGKKLDEFDSTRPQRPIRASGNSMTTPPPLSSNFERPEYLDAVGKIARYIIDGDIYQANLSQRFSTEYAGAPYDLFRRLYRINPAPFFAYMNCEDFHVLSSSPERFLRLRDGRVETRPIKGTAPRGATPAEDKRIAIELSRSIKDSAELSMIVDLVRNDIGRVCRYGTVEVTEHKRLEAYTNVFHLISVITGELRPERDAVDLIQATFPGGSITGCPKIRSMEIIDELEPNARGVYTGAIGYLGFDGAMDLNIAIRTIVLKDGRLTFHAGGGIVYDSDPQKEYEETIHKASSMIEAIRSGENL